MQRGREHEPIDPRIGGEDHARGPRVSDRVADFLTEDERASFQGRYRLKVVTGPLSLLRCGGTRPDGRPNDPFGRYWFPEDLFWKIADEIDDLAQNEELRGYYLRYLLREALAVSHDWSSLVTVFQFALPPGETVRVAVGFAAPQPFLAVESGALARAVPPGLFDGGAVQYVIDVRGSERLKSYVRGPMPLWRPKHVS